MHFRISHGIRLPKKAQGSTSDNAIIKMEFGGFDQLQRQLKAAQRAAESVDVDACPGFCPNTALWRLATTAFECAAVLPPAKAHD